MHFLISRASLRDRATQSVVDIPEFTAVQIVFTLTVKRETVNLCTTWKAVVQVILFINILENYPLGKWINRFNMVYHTFNILHALSQTEIT